MADTTLAYEDRIRDAESAREGQTRNLEHAAHLYRQASLLAPDEQKHIGAIEQEGVTWRLLGMFHYAKQCFTAALQAAEESGLSALVFSIQRNWSMLLVDMSDQSDNPAPKSELLSEAHRLAELSHKGFQSLAQLEQDEDAASKLTTEAFCSLGFLGRIVALQGDVVAGRCIMGEADLSLRGKHDVYERNNLVWLMRFTPRILRLSYLPRAIKLTRGSARLMEVLLIAVSNRLYQFVKSRYKRA